MTRTPRPLDLTTITDTEAVLHETCGDGSVAVHRFNDLEPATTTRLDVSTSEGIVKVDVTTLKRPEGELLCRFATVNDVHFGELAAGQIDNLSDGPIRRQPPGDEPYPEVMNQCAVTEMSMIDPAAVIVKGDLSLDGADDEWAAFERCYREPFGDRLHVVRGNHDAYRGQTAYAGDRSIELPGLTVALLDTTIPRATTGTISSDQTEWLDCVARDTSSPVIAMGHHQQWIPDVDDPESGTRRNPEYFGLHPDASDLLDDICVRRSNIIAYTAGHTHRHRRRQMLNSGVASIEVGCTKDFPGTWAEYRVFDGGVMQVVHRMSGDAALRWSESCRGLYSDFGVDYEGYALGALHDRSFVIPLR